MLDGMYPAPSAVVARIKSRIEVLPSGCWWWPGATSSGYGRITWVEDSGTRRWGAVHRVMYADVHGAIPEGLDVDHQCHDPASCQPDEAADCPHRRCCNPEHLLAMTRQENLLRGGTVTAERASVTVCPQGHDYTEDNTLTDKLGRRSCKECTYERNRAYFWANREKRLAYNREWHARRNRSRASIDEPGRSPRGSSAG